MRILALSDVVDERAYAPLGSSVGRVDLILGCGDLPYDYLDRVATERGAPLLAACETKGRVSVRRSESALTRDAPGAFLL